MHAVVFKLDLSQYSTQLNIFLPASLEKWEKGQWRKCRKKESLVRNLLADYPSVNPINHLSKFVIKWKMIQCEITTMCGLHFLENIFITMLDSFKKNKLVL